MSAQSSLATQLAGQMATRTAWLVGTSYLAGTAVTFGGAGYYALIDNIGVPPGTDPTTWGLLSGSGPLDCDDSDTQQPHGSSLRKRERVAGTLELRLSAMRRRELAGHYF